MHENTSIPRRWVLSYGQQAILNRITSKIRKDPVTGCWIWTGDTNRSGYGRVKVGARTVQVHRAVYELHGGYIPHGLEIDHLCRVRNCCNPEHLEPVTHQENVRRGLVCTNPKTHCSNGHAFDDENTAIRAGGNGRACRTCGKERQQRWRDKHAS